MDNRVPAPCANSRGSAPAPRRGFALIATLALIVLLTFIMVLFFSRATSNRQIEGAETGNQEADLLARGAMQSVINDLRQEMLASSTLTTTSGIPVLQPKTPAVMNPYRVLAPGISAADANFYNLLKQSGTNYLFSKTTSPYTFNSAAPMIIGSTNITDEPSANGRTVSATRWTAPLLTANGFSASNQLPTWVLVTRNGIPASQAWTSQFGNASQSNPSYVVGRFAFNVYDEGGLLDVNAAGYPSQFEDTSTLTPAQIGSLKSTLLGTSLSSIPGVSNSTALIQWRNMASAATASNFTNAASQEATNAFLTPLPGDNQYLSRQDLINYVQANPGVLSTASPNALQYLTTFSREPNAPSWWPDFNASTTTGVGGAKGNNYVVEQWSPFANGSNQYAYKSLANTAGHPNRFIPGVVFPASVGTGASITDYNSLGAVNSYLTTVSAGQPLVQRRFSLDKLSWIGPNGPGTTTAGTTPSAAAIQACFGLVWNGSNAWNYVGPSGTTIQSSIETLDQIAAEPKPRQPNFFELLKAGVLVGANGLIPSSSHMGSSWIGFNSNPDVQVLKIGANLIDQASSASNPPTCIMFNINIAYNVNANEPVIGSKSLPLINKFVITAEDPQQNNMATDDVNFWIEFEMWNPYAGASSITFPSKSSEPTFRIVYAGDPTAGDVTMPQLPTAASGGLSMSWKVYDFTGGTGFTVPPPSAGQTLTVSLKGIADKMDEPIMLDKVRADGASVTSSGSYTQLDIYNGTLNTPPITTATATGFWFGDEGSVDITKDPNLQPYLVDAAFYLQYYYSNYGWRTVQVIHELSDSSGDQLQCNIFSNNYQYIGEKQASYPLVDPRTDRLGGFEMDYLQGTVATGAWNGASVNNPFWGKSLFANPGDPSTQFYCKGYLSNNGLFGPALVGALQVPAVFRYADNSGSVTTPFEPQTCGQAYLDPDSIQRPGDGVWNSANTSLGVYPFSTASLRLANYPGATVDPERPVMLNRPFQNVGEMAYAFRDTPWRSVDFSSPYSGDAALMDLFCVGDDTVPVHAGRVNLNRASQTVLAALLNGANKDVLNGTYLSSTDAANGAAALNTALQTTPAYSKGQYFEYLSYSALNSISLIKSQREAVARSLIDVTQVRTWNLLIDIVAQAGRFSPAATSGDQFTVQGERRYWLHLAIDRYTGQVVDQELEPVNE